MTSLAYRRSGSGEPLVLLHPLGSSRQAWDPVAPALARHFDVIAVDMPGFGESAPLPGEPSPAALAAGAIAAAIGVRGALWVLMTCFALSAALLATPAIRSARDLPRQPAAALSRAGR